MGMGASGIQLAQRKNQSTLHAFLSETAVKFQVDTA